MFRIDLRRLILVLSVFSVVAVAANGFYANYRVQRALLISNTLENNRVYAAKLADTTNGMLANARGGLAYAALVLGADGALAAQAQAEATRLWLQSSYFNSVLVADQAGAILAVAPSALRQAGAVLKSAGMRSALQARRPFITQPYRAATGRWVVTLSHPIIASDGRYLGIVGGTIYLHEANVLHKLLGEQLHRDGSYVYVVDGTGHLLYHPKPERVGELVTQNAVVMRAIGGESGSAEVVNTQGEAMLAAYAPIGQAQWGVVSQRSLGSTLDPLDDLMLRNVQRSLPLFAIVLLGIWWASARIARPLWQLASVARRMGGHDAGEGIARVRAWYFEASQLRRALLAGLSSLQGVIRELRHASLTDALTGLVNRRGLAMVLEELRGCGVPFGVVSLDVDHFKQINDTYGHAAGDKVLQMLAELMQQHSRAGDVAARVGGEEFVMLLPHTTQDESCTLAERLRTAVQAARTPHGRKVTLSLGVAHCFESAATGEEALERADAALYEAKRAGRNRVGVAAVTGAPASATLAT